MMSIVKHQNYFSKCGFSHHKLTLSFKKTNQKVEQVSIETEQLSLKTDIVKFLSFLETNLLDYGVSHDLVLEALDNCAESDFDVNYFTKPDKICFTLNIPCEWRFEIPSKYMRCIHCNRNLNLDCWEQIKWGGKKYCIIILQGLVLFFGSVTTCVVFFAFIGLLVGSQQNKG